MNDKPLHYLHLKLQKHYADAHGGVLQLVIRVLRTGELKIIILNNNSFNLFFLFSAKETYKAGN